MKTSPRQAHNVSFRMAKPPNKELVCRFGHLLQPGLIHLWLAPVWVIICVNWFLIQVILFSIASCGKPLARYAGIRPSGSVMDSTLSKSVWNQPIQNFFLFSLISPWARDKYGIGVFSFGFCRIKEVMVSAGDTCVTKFMVWRLWFTFWNSIKDAMDFADACVQRFQPRVRRTDS